ncbi:hypothetical protein L2E82_47315 [Cichorium intybus]|uniref:Uncharacterized protein n=1 Tax=Cichorium intybus TaxID=13427 RepID=A0ACB8YV56_CICIN|nr:hypothetical protein L2E82_47315 [Cichorium intybus]
MNKVGRTCQEGDLTKENPRGHVHEMVIGMLTRPRIRHMTGDISQLHDIQNINGGYVSFAGGEKGKITQMGTVTNGVGFSTHFTKKECLILNPGIVIPEEWILVRSKRKSNAYIIDMNHNIPENVTCLFSRISEQNAMLWHLRLGHANAKNLNSLAKNDLVWGLPIKDFITFENCNKSETAELLKRFIVLIENQTNQKVKGIRCDNGTEFKNAIQDQFCAKKGVQRQYSVARAPQQNEVAERRNRTLIDAARTMICDSKLPVFFWAEAINTAWYAGCTAYRVYNEATKQIVESFDVRWLEENKIDACVGCTQPDSCGIDKDEDEEIIAEPIKPSVLDDESTCLNNDTTSDSPIIDDDASADSPKMVDETPVAEETDAPTGDNSPESAEVFNSMLMHSLFPERIPDEYVRAPHTTLDHLVEVIRPQAKSRTSQIFWFLWKLSNKLFLPRFNAIIPSTMLLVRWLMRSNPEVRADMSTNVFIRASYLKSSRRTLK